jgi:hypothetical protein
VDGLDDLAAVDALEIDAGDASEEQWPLTPGPGDSRL